MKGIYTMKVNYESKQIEMTKKDARECATVGSDAYDQLVKAKRDFPDFTVVIRETKSASKRTNGVKGLSYERMELYVQKRGNEEQMQQFNALRQAAKESFGGFGKAYLEVRDWFIHTFPEACDYKLAAEQIVGRAC